MRPIVFAISLLLVCCGGTRAAFADCLIIDQLDQMHGLQTRLARNPSTVLFTDDIRQLRSMSSGLNNRDTLAAVNGNAFTGKGATFIRFLQNTQALLQSTSMDDPYSVRPHFTPAVRQNLENIRVHLPDLRCKVEQITVEKAVASDRDFNGDDDSDSEDLQEVQQALSSLAAEVVRPRNLILTIVSIGLVMLILPMIRHWLILRKRQAKRHNTTFVTDYRAENVTTEGMLIDINCYGTKLRHSRDSPHAKGMTLEISLLGEWINGSVMWSNTHYSGVQFKKLISLAEVSAICSADREAKSTAQTKRRPKRRRQQE